MAPLAPYVLLTCLTWVVMLTTLLAAGGRVLRLKRHEEALRRQETSRLALNLPGELLAQRMRWYRVEGTDEQTGLHRTYAIEARHAGAAWMKARKWGILVDQIDEHPPTRPATGH